MPKILGLVLLCAGVADCKDAKQHNGPMPQPSKAPPEGHAFDTGQVIKLPEKTEPATAAPAPATAAGQLVLPASLLKKLEASLPKLDAVRSLETLQVVPQSRMARQILCFELNVEAATSQLLRAYRETAWQEIAVHTPSHDATRRSFSAVTKDFRLTGSIYQGNFKDCEKSAGFTRASLSFHENHTKSELPGVPPKSKLKKPASLVRPHKMMRAQQDAVVKPAR